MKRKIIEIECDVCHKDITNMCERCFRELQQFIRNETVRQSTGGKQ